MCFGENVDEISLRGLGMWWMREKRGNAAGLKLITFSPVFAAVFMRSWGGFEG